MEWQLVGDGEAVPYGEPVLGWSQGDGIFIVVRTSYDRDPEDEWRWFQLIYGSAYSNTTELEREPTHWMPLPKEPAQ